MIRLTLKQAQKIQLFIPNYLSLISDAVFNGKDHILLNEYEYQLALNKQSASKEKQKALADCVRRNNKGIAYEKEGKLKLAIKTYEGNIKQECFPAHHSFKRLMVLFRKNKDYENEIRVIKRALEVFPDYPEYIQRLEKINNLINK